MAPLMRYLTRLCWLMRQGEPVADVLVYVPSEDVFARMGTAIGGSLDAWREARQLIGDDLIRRSSGRVAGTTTWSMTTRWRCCRPTGSRPVIIAGATALPAEVQAWFEAYATGGGAVIVVDSAVDIAGATTCGRADLAATLAASCPSGRAAHSPDAATQQGGRPP